MIAFSPIETMPGRGSRSATRALSVVGTTVKRADHLPTDLVADEKQSWLKGERVYIATTAGQECILGASVSKSAGQADLKDAYGVVAVELLPVVS